MKRIVSIVFAVILIVSVGCQAFAYDEEILFRNIPWGSSTSDARKALSGSQVFFMPGNQFNNYVEDKITAKESKRIDMQSDLSEFFINAFVDNLSVAGYKVDETTMCFVYTPSIDMPIEKALLSDNANTALYFAQYSFRPSNVAAVRADLLDKLASIYGAPDECIVNTDIVNIEFTYDYWYGANDTLLVLRSNNNSSSTMPMNPTETVDIFYAWKNGDNLINKAIESKSVLESNLIDSFNTDGL